MNDAYDGRTRQGYLDDLAMDYGVPTQKVYALAHLLGPDEDFDGLINAIEDMANDEIYQ